MIHSGKNTYSFVIILLTLLSLVAITACQPATNTNSNTSPVATPSPSVSPSASPSVTGAVITLPVLDALFSDEGFKSKLKSSVQLTDEQVAQLQKAAADEVSRLREANTEDAAEQAATQSRANADAAIRKIVGDGKSAALQTFAHNYWISGGEVAAGDRTANGMLPGPNAVPKDTRVVVNIPAYRMDVFREGTLVKSYKVGIGYPDFPLPTGLRKAQTIIINPTWTPPDEPWVAKMKGVEAGEKVAAGSKLNPLGPVKSPIGLPSLIHGGKSPAKLGTFASHGCVGLTSPQVLDFSKLLAQIGGADLPDKQLQSYLKDKTKTETVKLDQPVPVELRYETIVVQDGKLHIYRDVYAIESNTEANLRAVLAANGIQFDSLTPEEQTQIRDALVAMGGTASSATTPPKVEPSPATKDSSPAAKEPKTTDKKVAAAGKKPIGKNQKEVVIELASLKGKGYPTAVNWDTGSGKPAALVAAVR